MTALGRRSLRIMRAAEKGVSAATKETPLNPPLSYSCLHVNYIILTGNCTSHRGTQPVCISFRFELFKGFEQERLRSWFETEEQEEELEKWTFAISPMLVVQF